MKAQLARSLLGRLGWSNRHRYRGRLDGTSPFGWYFRSPDGESDDDAMTAIGSGACRHRDFARAPQPDHSRYLSRFAARQGPGIARPAGRRAAADRWTGHSVSGLTGAPFGHSRKILPGFMRPLGSSAFLIARIVPTADAPCSVRRCSRLTMPMPCSPVQLPPAAMARSIIAS